VATFDILPTDEIFGMVLTQFPEVEAFTPKFERLNYGSMFIVMNMGTMLLVFICYILLYAIYPCTRLVGRHSPRAARLEQSLKKMLFWNHVIVFLQEGFLEILISGVINCIYMTSAEDPWGNWNLVFTNSVTIFLIAICALLIALSFYLWPKHDELKQKKYRERFGSIYGMVDTKRSKWSMLFPVLFFLRRIIFVVAVVALIDYPTFQIYLFLFPTLVVMITLG